MVFGSYLNDGDLGLRDVDVVIGVSSRIEDPNQRPEAHLCYARESGGNSATSPRNFIGQKRKFIKC